MLSSSRNVLLKLSETTFHKNCSHLIAGVYIIQIIDIFAPLFSKMIFLPQVQWKFPLFPLFPPFTPYICVFSFLNIIIFFPQPTNMGDKMKNIQPCLIALHTLYNLHKYVLNLNRGRCRIIPGYSEVETNECW